MTGKTPERTNRTNPLNQLHHNQRLQGLQSVNFQDAEPETCHFQKSGHYLIIAHMYK